MEKPEAVAIKIPSIHNLVLGIRAGKGSEYIDIYINGQWAADIKLENIEECTGLRIFAPNDTGEPKYHFIGINPRGKDEYTERRNPEFKYHDFDFTL